MQDGCEHDVTGTERQASSITSAESRLCERCKALQAENEIQRALIAKLEQEHDVLEARVAEVRRLQAQLDEERRRLQARRR